MRWLDLPALAEFEDRSGTVRRIYGLSVLGRYQFADRMGDIGRLLGEGNEPWAAIFAGDPALRAAINGALECWGISPDWLSEGQIEALLLYRQEGEEAKGGWLMELLETGSKKQGKGKEQTLAETLAAISTHCQSLQEAIDLANEVPADLLLDILSNKPDATAPQDRTRDNAKDAAIKANFNQMMAAAKDLGSDGRES